MQVKMTDYKNIEELRNEAVLSDAELTVAEWRARRQAAKEGKPETKLVREPVALVQEQFPAESELESWRRNRYSKANVKFTEAKPPDNPPQQKPNPPPRAAPSPQAPKDKNAKVMAALTKAAEAEEYINELLETLSKKGNREGNLMNGPDGEVVASAHADFLDLVLAYNELARNKGLGIGMPIPFRVKAITELLGDLPISQVVKGMLPKDGFAPLFLAARIKVVDHEDRIVRLGGTPVSSQMVAYNQSIAPAFTPCSTVMHLNDLTNKLQDFRPIFRVGEPSRGDIATLDAVTRSPDKDLAKEALYTLDRVKAAQHYNTLSNGTPNGMVGRLSIVKEKAENAKQCGTTLGTTMYFNPNDPLSNHPAFREYLSVNMPLELHEDAPDTSKPFDANLLDVVTHQFFAYNGQSSAGPFSPPGTKQGEYIGQALSQAREFFTFMSRPGLDDKTLMSVIRLYAVSHTKPKFEVMAVESHYSKGRNINVVPFFANLLFSYVLGAVRVRHALEEPLSTTLTGFGPFAGNLKKVLDLLVSRPDVMYVYSDNIYTVVDGPLEKDDDGTELPRQKIWCSMDVGKSEATIGTGIALTHAARVVQLYEARYGTMHIGWKNVLLKAYPTFACNGIGVLGSEQFSTPFLISGIYGTSDLNNVGSHAKVFFAKHVGKVPQPVNFVYGVDWNEVDEDDSDIEDYDPFAEAKMKRARAVINPAFAQFFQSRLGVEMKIEGMVDISKFEDGKIYKVDYLGVNAYVWEGMVAPVLDEDRRFKALAFSKTKRHNTAPGQMMKISKANSIILLSADSPAIRLSQELLVTGALVYMNDLVKDRMASMVENDPSLVIDWVREDLGSMGVGTPESADQIADVLMTIGAVSNEDTLLLLYGIEQLRTLHPDIVLQRLAIPQNLAKLAVEKFVIPMKMLRTSLVPPDTTYDLSAYSQPLGARVKNVNPTGEYRPLVASSKLKSMGPRVEKISALAKETSSEVTTKLIEWHNALVKLDIVQSSSAVSFLLDTPVDGYRNITLKQLHNGAILSKEEANYMWNLALLSNMSGLKFAMVGAIMSTWRYTAYAASKKISGPNKNMLPVEYVSRESAMVLTSNGQEFPMAEYYTSILRKIEAQSRL